MNFAVLAAAIVILLSACSSNHPADVYHQQAVKNQRTINTVEANPKQLRSPVIPIDGRLRDEHIQMYVSVRIKQEQIRFQREELRSTFLAKRGQQSSSTPGKSQVVNLKDSTSIISQKQLEKMAVEEFDFNVQLYHWAKQTIQRTQTYLTNDNIMKSRRASSFEEYVLSHNLKMLDKYQDELRFAVNYKIELPSTIKHDSAKAGAELASESMTTDLKPSS